MKRTDYADVSARYDDNELRHRIPRDERVGELLRERAGARVAVLDLACGTGNYLRVQAAAFAGSPVAWSGVDASPEMLGKAKEKLPGIDLREGRAEALPYDDGAFDYVTTHFAFHHFADKQRALDHAVRVLAEGGIFRVVNIAPEYMPRWWLYRFFPGSWFDDQDRFWPIERVGFELERRGLDVELKVEIDKAPVSIAHALADTERRELSQLAIADDGAYAEGLARLRARNAADPHERGASEIALVELVARRSSRPPPLRW